MKIVDIHVFSSSDITNIWAGIGAGKWAVSNRQAKNIDGMKDRVEKIQVGAWGVLYCVQTHTFTTPFLFASKPDQDNDEQKVWSEPWSLPFRIKHLGTPYKGIYKDRLPEVSGLAAIPWNRILNVAPLFAFVSSPLEETHWGRILSELMD